jgi:hypothetical protein
MADHHTAKTSEELGYETSDADIKPLAYFAIYLGIFIFISIVGMVVLFKFFDYYQSLYDNPTPPLAETRRMAENIPRLQVDPPQQKKELTLLVSERLTTYDWVNREAKVARIPVDRAMELLATGKIPMPRAPKAPAQP